ncbi:gluconokinase [Deinococcus altitudinis]|uniref:gluconokinase n=1 Tax=Deinococcus altitudinis TaxID=468914 RepID=UPI0038927F18
MRGGSTEVVIGLDLGTTSVKALALSGGGEVLARSGGGYALHSGAADSGTGAEATQDAGEVVRAALAALEDLAAQLAGMKIPATVRAIVPSAAMHSLVLVGHSGEVLAPALTWADTRPAETLDSLHAVLDAESSYARTGCPLQTPYHPARLWWLSRTRPELFAQAARFVSLTDLLLHRLTGEWTTSAGLASTTGLWNLHTAEWDPQILSVLGVSQTRLPAVLDAREVVGAVLAGPLAGTPVLAGSSDGALANLGAGALLGETVVTVGTSGAVRRLSSGPHLDLHTSDSPASSPARTWSYRLDLSTHLSGGAINNGGLLLDWVRGGWYSELDAHEGFARLLSDAAGVPAGAEGLTLLPYLTGERSPYWRSDLSATLHGLKLTHGRAQVARAALEAVAFSLAQVWELVNPEPGEGAGLKRAGTVCSTGGLAASPIWNSLLADVLGVPVRVQDAADASAIGAALLGHPAAVLQSIRQQAQTGAVFSPAGAGKARGPLGEARNRWQALYARLHGTPETDSGRSVRH